MLSGPEIRRQRELGTIIIEPWDDACVGPNSYDVMLLDELKTPDICQNNAAWEPANGLDVRKEPRMIWTSIPAEGLWLMPNRLYLGCTVEHTETQGFVPRISGVSTNGRYGIQVHQTAGEGEDGFVGQWTLEIVVVQPVKVYAGMRIAAIFYELLQGERQPYEGRYQKQHGPTAARL